LPNKKVAIPAETVLTDIHISVLSLLNRLIIVETLKRQFLIQSSEKKIDQAIGLETKLLAMIQQCVPHLEKKHSKYTEILDKIFHVRKLHETNTSLMEEIKNITDFYFLSHDRHSLYDCRGRKSPMLSRHMILA